MKVNQDLLKAAIGWDLSNWVRALDFWSSFGDFNNKTVLELGCGCNNGGLSLWAAALGAERVTCSDYNLPREVTVGIHKKYGFDSIIEYAAVDALNIPYSNSFDIVLFKSMLGGIVRQNDQTIVCKVLKNIAKALKPGGMLLFAENLSGSFFHMFLRSRFGAGKNNWRYFNNGELAGLISAIPELEFLEKQNVGVLGCFGRSESQRILFGKLDKLFFERILPESCRYIQFIAARKR